jgi:hypothetical protein
MFSTHSILITFFLCSCERLFWPRFQALGWWNVLYICFRFGWSCTAIPEQANRRDENIMFLFFPLHYCWSFPLLLVRIGFGVLSDDLDSDRVTRLNSWSGFLWFLMLHFLVWTCVAKTLTFSSFQVCTPTILVIVLCFVHRPFWLFLCKWELLLDLDSFQFASPSRFSLLPVFWLGQFWVFNLVSFRFRFGLDNSGV